MTNEQWENILSRAGAVFNFGIEKKEQLKNSRMAKLIAAIPFLAGCNKATETAFSHLTIYLMSLDESAKDIYFHKPEDDDDIYSRLFPISVFNGGNKIIIQCYMDLIALCMLSNYKKNAAEDKAIGKYNPINAGKWDYDTMSANLIQNIDKTSTADISAVYSKEDAVRGFWKE
ncbi:MAG: hypothetical protein KAR21_25895 [Spirochaetales bacterium]|nr:hypothetical protein [Spirochaetales bacterium]